MEILNLYDDLGNLINETVKRGTKPEKGNIMLSILFITNDKEKFLIQKTSKEKGSEYSTTGGHVLNEETPVETIIRETKEEIGLELAESEIKYIGLEKNSELPILFSIYKVTKNIDICNLKLQKEEVESIEWFTKEKIISLIKENKFKKSHANIFEKYFIIGGKNEKVESKDYLGKKVSVKMNIPLGSKHPKHGFIPNTISGDGEELDAYLIGVFEPVEEYEGIVIAIIRRINNNDDKLIVAPENKNYTDEQIKALTEFQEQYFESVIIRNQEEYKKQIARTRK